MTPSPAGSVQTQRDWAGVGQPAQGQPHQPPRLHAVSLREGVANGEERKKAKKRTVPCFRPATDGQKQNPVPSQKKVVTSPPNSNAGALGVDRRLWWWGDLLIGPIFLKSADFR